MAGGACSVFRAGLRVARVLAESLYSGVSRSRERGLGLEYVDFRDYVYGDDVRYVDWRLSARSIGSSGDLRLVVKVFEAERLVDAVFVIDLTASMGFGEKLWMLGYVSMVLGSLAASLEDRVTLVTVGDGVRVLAPRSPREAPLVIEGLVCRGGAPRGSTGFDVVAARLRRVHYRPVVVVSDYAHSVEELYNFLRAMRAQRNRVYTVLLLDRYEVVEPVDAVSSLADPETGAIVSGRLSRVYASIRRHVAGVRAVARLYSTRFLELVGKSSCPVMRHRLVEGYLATRGGR